MKMRKPIESEEIRLSGNKNLAWSSCIGAKCESFDASYCLLSEIPMPIMNCLDLRNLSLAFNQISDLAAIKPLKNLRVLLLSNNKLRDLNDLTETVREFPHLSVLDISNNLFIPRNADKSQVEVAEIVMKTCILLACKQLKTLNRTPVSSSDHKKASKRMLHLKEIAREYAQNSADDFFENWEPELQPLEDMTAGEDLVLEIL
jgi:Leucine-rich repeat (LRR) protein